MVTTHLLSKSYMPLCGVQTVGTGEVLRLVPTVSSVTCSRCKEQSQTV